MSDDREFAEGQARAFGAARIAQRGNQAEDLAADVQLATAGIPEIGAQGHDRISRVRPRVRCRSSSPSAGCVDSSALQRLPSAASRSWT